MGWIKKITKAGKRKTAGMLAIVLAITGIGVPMPSLGSEIWPQKSTAPFYCIDGGKGWKSADRYEIYKYDTLPSLITEVQAKRLFWAYPSNWKELKKAAEKYDVELYKMIAGADSDPNVVKHVKDDPGTKFALVADNPEIEQRAIAVLEKAAAGSTAKGKEAPEEIREATSEEKAVSYTVLPFSAGPAALNTEFKIGSEFVKDIAKIEAQSVWDNGSDGGTIGWLDASQDNNIAKSVLGDSLYEITWGGDSIKVRNNGSAAANEKVVGSTMSEEQKYNKTTVRYKITMRENSGWYTEGRWDPDYLREWMDFKACPNSPGHQRLYKADIRIVPSDQVFYLVISQKKTEDTYPAPEYGNASSEYKFQIYRHEEEFKATYNVKLKKTDDETEKPLKNSQFYLYERFEDEELLGDEADGGLSKDNLNFQPWSGFQVFAEGTTDENGEISHTDIRKYRYSKTYCDGHGMPDWADVPEKEQEEDSEEVSDDSGAEEARDQNRRAAKLWMEHYEACEEESENSDTHFHWLAEESVYDVVNDVLDSGEPGESENGSGADAETAFVRSGCKADCEKTYDSFIQLRFSYTWKEIQARNGYILHDIHEKDVPIEIITTSASENGAEAVRNSGSSRDIRENVWYTGNRKQNKNSAVKSRRMPEREKILRNWNAESDSDAVPADKGIKWPLYTLGKWLKKIFRTEKHYASDSDALEDRMTSSNAERSNAAGSNAEALCATDSDTVRAVRTGSDAVRIYESGMKRKVTYSDGDDDWEELQGEDFASCLEQAEIDDIKHLKKNDSGIFSYPAESGWDHWLIKDHRTEGKIKINKKDMDLYKGESDDYSAFGDTEGDSVLEGAVYGLFAAEDIIHPDSEVASEGGMTNTGIVYQKNDLVSVAVTDTEGNAEFLAYTTEPGMTYDYKLREIVKRKDTGWTGPENRYEENFSQYGNWWIGRPLILGNYYIKELLRSGGYELSVNGKSKEWSNYGSDMETPVSIVDSNGVTIVEMSELTASMEGENESGEGYDQFSFSVTSSGTADTENGRDGYEILVSGFPENTKFYRVDSGKREVTGPHVTGTEEKILTDANGEILWKKAENDISHVRYEPEYDGNGVLTGQKVMSHEEPQTLSVLQVPQASESEWKKTETELDEEILKKTLTEETFGFLKAETERILCQNGYEIPVTYEGISSKPNEPVYSMGVKKGELDIYGMTVKAGEAASKTVYGMAIRTLIIEDADESTTILELLQSIISWYRENPQWSFGGIHQIQWKDGRLEVSLYVGASVSGSRRFFTMKKEDGKATVDKVYAVIENPQTLRWEYQEYDREGIYQYQVLKQYSFGTGAQKRYYIDVVLMPVVMIGQSGNIEIIKHTVMEYHKTGEEIVDYLNGDSKNGYRIPQTELTDKIEITTEVETVEEDVRIQDVSYDEKTGTHRIRVKSSGIDAFGREFSDEDQSLTLTFMAKLPERKSVITAQDIEYIGNGNVYGYQAGDRIGFAEYLIRFKDASISAAAGSGKELSDTYIISKSLVYHGQNCVIEDGNTDEVPVQVLQRPIKQKIKVMKETEGGQAVTNFRFKIYLKSNLERLYCDTEGNIEWIDRYGNTVDIKEYKKKFPELVQKIYTRKTERRLLEEDNYEKLFDAVQTANTDVWRNEGILRNTSGKPVAKNLLTGTENTINTSLEAKENAERSDAVRQFAVTWYLEDEIQKSVSEIPDGDGYLADAGSAVYQDEVYDHALYQAILRAETYLKPFFSYDIDSIYAILWDSEKNGGIDKDESTLSADLIENGEESSDYAYGISKYLPYGKYMLTEQQPYRAEWFDLKNRHYKIDTPKEIELPKYSEAGKEIPYDQVEWSVTEPGTKSDMVGYADQSVFNEDYKVKLRIEKLDRETGESILHEDAVFALYKAEREEEPDTEGAVKRYETDSVIAGSQEFLEAMGAERITPFARSTGKMYFGLVKKGTPICREEDAVILNDKDGKITGAVLGLSTIKDSLKKGIFQTVGYAETPESIKAGVYVLAELKTPSGYARSSPIAIEVYSDAVRYYPDGKMEKAAAIKFDDGNTETARIYVNDTAVTLEVSKLKTADRHRGMKISGRVDGTISELNILYGLENLDLAYNSMGTYQGFGWKKGFLELLEERKAQGEQIELVYENGVFQGYGYVNRKLETSDDENRYAAGAELALYDAVTVRGSGDSQDYAFEGVRVIRDRNGNVERITVKEGFAGEKTELVQSQNGIWKTEKTARKETPVLFYGLGNLKVIEKGDDGTLYGYDKNCRKIKINADTKSVYAVRGGRAEFEIVSQDFSQLVYSKEARAFTAYSEDTVIYHLNENLGRDSQTDGYTGLAYVVKAEKNLQGKEENRFYLWPIVEIMDAEGNLISREKILTGRPGEKNEGTENAYLTGTWNAEKHTFEKKLVPVYDKFGMVQYYLPSDIAYKKGTLLRDRDGDILSYRYDDLLKSYNRAAYQILDHDALYETAESEEDGTLLKRRFGEAWMIPNIWVSGERKVQDPEISEMSLGQADILRRVIPGTYIMEEISAPDGYVRAMPAALSVEETAEIQRVSMTNEKIKAEILKVDGAEQYKNPVLVNGKISENEWYTEGNGAYTGKLVVGAKMALYKAKRIYVSDYKKYPKGYYLVKAESTPAEWTTENPADNSPVIVKAFWVTDGHPKYFEGIPAGDYILEELETPSGYVASSMEITIKETEKLQSFLMLDDHTKVEILKYTTDQNGVQKQLPKGEEAELTLYPAVLDLNGEPIVRNGQIQYEKEKPIDTWTAADRTEEYTAIKNAYEAMYVIYGNTFDRFSWEIDDDGAVRTKYAKLEKCRLTVNGENTVQIWEKEDGTKIRIRASQNGTSKTDCSGSIETAFSYDFQYKEKGEPLAPYFISYDTENGIHRLDWLPTGVYVLVETRIPAGYQKEDPVVIHVEEVNSVQRFTMENEKEYSQAPKGKLLIEKADAEDPEKKLSGAWFEVENLSTGKCFRKGTDESGTVIFDNLPTEGVNRDGKWEKYVYLVKETTAPAGYHLETGRKVFMFWESNAENLVYRLTVKDQKTKVSIQKTDLVTGEELPGAELTLKDKKGTIIDQWVSGKMPHEINGRLIAGETYILVEKSAPDGYLVAENVEFTVSEDGTVNRVIMEDAREDKSEEPENPDIPKTPEVPEIPEIPEKPQESDTPDSEHTTPKVPSETPDVKYGKITAVYDIPSFSDRVVYLDDIIRVKNISIPKTGDEAPIMLAGILTAVSLTGIVLLYLTDRRNRSDRE